MVIAHRLYTLRHADLILVLSGGRIVQRGTHDELLDEPGLYQTVYRQQSRDPEDAAVLSSSPVSAARSQA